MKWNGYDGPSLTPAVEPAGFHGPRIYVSGTIVHESLADRARERPPHALSSGECPGE